MEVSQPSHAGAERLRCLIHGRVHNRLTHVVPCSHRHQPVRVVLIHGIHSSQEGEDDHEEEASWEVTEVVELAGLALIPTHATIARAVEAVPYSQTQGHHEPHNDHYHAPGCSL